MATAKKLKSGTWRIEVYIGRDENGKKIRKYITAPTRWEAEKLADEYIKNEKHKTPTFSVGDAISGYIDLKRNVLSPSTINGYEIVRRNRLKSLMVIDVTDVNNITMQRAISEDSRTVGRKTIKEAVNLVLAALKMYGIKVDLNVTLPPKKAIIRELPEPVVVLKAIKGSDVELACLLAIWLSLRMSEVRGLQFRDIKDGKILVRRSKIFFAGEDHIRDFNKTYSSTRAIRLPEYIQKMIDDVPHNSDEDFIIDMDYQTIARHFKKLLMAEGYDMHFHDLRHLNASVMLALGIPDKYAMERGGWSTNQTMKNVYQHVFQSDRERADIIIDAYFNELISK